MDKLNKLLASYRNLSQAPNSQIQGCDHGRSSHNDGIGNGLAIDLDKMKQATELQIKLENQSCGAQPMNADLETHTKPKSCLKATSLNAQGEWVKHNPNIYLGQPNKYQVFKNLSPEMFNQIHGKPGDQPIISACDEKPTEDVFDLTSFKYNHQFARPNQMLRKQIDQSYQRILQKKEPLRASNQFNRMMGR